MIFEKKDERKAKYSADNEVGQSLVLIAFIIVALLAFAGLATDAGMLFARSSQFSAAIDAATLAGVVDLPAGVGAAEMRAQEFLDANRWPISQAITSTASESSTALGYPQLNYTVTYPVETFFLALLGFDEVPITHSASAAIYSWADMPTATQAELGILRVAGQYVYGPDSCTAQGDPVSASRSDSGVPNPLRTEAGGKYTYRIRVPDSYPGGVELEVQLFDPDALNLRSGNGDVIELTGGGTRSDMSCSSSGNGDSCFISTGEDVTANPVWLRRLDETWLDTGGCPIRNESDPSGDTITRYELFNLDDDGNRVDLVAFQSGAASDTQTDMKWVTPGLGGIPAETGTVGSFRIPAGVVSAITPDQDGYRNIYMDVRTVAGVSKNGWDVWAGPPNGSLPADGNQRNLYILRNLNSVSSEGVEVFAQSYLPTSSYFFGPPSLPIASVDQSLGGSTISVSVFDFDPPASDPIQFAYSSVTVEDWPPVDQNALCSGSMDCNNKWVEPPFNLAIPSPEGTPPVAFYGGYLTASYSMNNDEHVWSATLPLGRPFLTR